MAVTWKMDLGVVAEWKQRWSGDRCGMSEGRQGQVWTSTLPCDAQTLGWPFVNTVDKYENKNPIHCGEWRRKSSDPKWHD